MSWLPTTSLDALKQRAQFYAYIREFFTLRNVLEVETPLLSHAAVSDVNLYPVQARCNDKSVFLHTSPEYPMKRLLASGSGDIYQICKVFRDGERGSRHNPEFSMLEYYRLRFDLNTLMDEAAQLVGDYLNIQQRFDYSYQQAMTTFAGIDAFNADDETLRARVAEFVGPDLELNRDACLDLIMSYVVEPSLPKNALVFVSAYPASQASLANTYENATGHQVAKRFELYVNGFELANGYDELVDVSEQKKRFEAEQAMHETSRPMDQNFIDALAHGLPICSGVALGLDRILMLKLGAEHIDKVMSFNFENC